ncbi:MAG: diacylglycerol kinase family protein [Bacteroidia bacterium]|nr:diacylglycerol kinase family protein [Bacteroidia bacterium]
MTKKESFLVNRLKSIGFACRGALLLLKTEASIQIQFVIAVLVTIAGLYFNISSVEWIMQILAIGLVMGLEGINTALEKLADFTHPHQNDKIGFIKDIAAGAVFFGAIAAILVGIIIYYPRLF